MQGTLPHPSLSRPNVVVHVHDECPLGFVCTYIARGGKVHRDVVVPVGVMRNALKQGARVHFD